MFLVESFTPLEGGHFDEEMQREGYWIAEGIFRVKGAADRFVETEQKRQSEAFPPGTQAIFKIRTRWQDCRVVGKNVGPVLAWKMFSQSMGSSSVDGADWV